MANIDTSLIIDKLKEAVNDKAHFFELFLTAYDFPKASIKRAIDSMSKSGIRKCSIKQKLLYHETTKKLETEYFDLLEERNAKERFLFVTDFKHILAKDMLSDKGIEINFTELPDNYEFFFPWCGREVIEADVENPADVKAATEMGHLFELIRKVNENNTALTERYQNIFLTRLLFCFFADDTGIFTKDLFKQSLILNTAEDGSDTKIYLTGLFVILDTKIEERKNIHPMYKDFPYVNGGLFKEHILVPNFDKTSRRKMLECCAVDWSGINPDIFGSMFQTVINPDQRRNLGQHYTSVTNIMKVIRPLFLDSLNDELDEILKIKAPLERDTKLDKLRNRLSKIKIFDPACGSGNFLIVAYKELCHLEMRIIDSFNQFQMPYLNTKLSNFYGIEIDDFPCEVARLSLWLAQHQINLECYSKLKHANPTLPLTDPGNIVCGNALRIDWKKVCPADGEVYICGNPPFAGHQTKDDNQRADMKWLFDGRNIGTTDLDYVSCWFIKAADYIRGNKNCKFGLVSTNSVCQGRHVSALWPNVLRHDEEIFFGYESFKWKNNAKDNAGVTVTIIGVRNNCNEPKYLFNESQRTRAQNISYYLKDEEQKVTVTKTNTIPEGLPKCEFGSMAQDDGNLILATKEKELFLAEHNAAGKYIKKLIGSDEFIKGKERWCLWIKDCDVNEALKYDEIKHRLDNVREVRLKSSRATTREHALIPWAFGERRFQDGKCAIIIPATSSENRKYIPVGYLAPNIVITNSAFAIYDAPLWLFAILTSNMHMIWMRAVSGKLETRYRYSNTLVYNTFPFPQLSDLQKQKLEKSAQCILDIRESHYEMTMAQLYDSSTMPSDLKTAHESNDLLVDSFYKKTGFVNDEERLAELFRLYEKNLKERNNA